MRRLIACAVSILVLASSFTAAAATGRVVKVLPHLLDLQGRHSLSPSLFDRDAYQAKLRQHPELRSAIRFDILWRARVATRGNLRLRAELRGSAKGELPRQVTLETEIPARAGGTSKWTSLKLGGEAYKKFGELTAWRVTLWDGDQLVGEQKSFLW